MRDLAPALMVVGLAWAVVVVLCVRWWLEYKQESLWVDHHTAILKDRVGTLKSGERIRYSWEETEGWVSAEEKE